MSTTPIVQLPFKTNKDPTTLLGKADTTPKGDGPKTVRKSLTKHSPLSRGRSSYYRTYFDKAVMLRFKEWLAKIETWGKQHLAEIGTVEEEMYYGEGKTRRKKRKRLRKKGAKIPVRYGKPGRTKHFWEVDITRPEWWALWMHLSPRIPVDFPLNGFKNWGDPGVKHVSPYHLYTSRWLERSESACEALSKAGEYGSSPSPLKPRRKRSEALLEGEAFKEENKRLQSEGKSKPVFKVILKKKDENVPYIVENLKIVLLEADRGKEMFAAPWNLTKTTVLWEWNPDVDKQKLNNGIEDWLERYPIERVFHDARIGGSFFIKDPRFNHLTNYYRSEEAVLRGVKEIEDEGIYQGNPFPVDLPPEIDELKLRTEIDANGNRVLVNPLGKERLHLSD
jgi:hypothetical protein